MTQESITCLNGSFVPTSEAKLPIADRGFRFGDGVFETMHVEGRVPYQWEVHLKRLRDGLKALRIPEPDVDWQASAKRLIQENAAGDGFLRLAISRGVGSRGYLPRPDIRPNWVMEWLPPSPAPDAPATLYQTAITRPPLSALPVNYKLAQGVASTLALLDARDHGADEALMLSPEGFLCEAASANLFWIDGNELFTPSLKTGCLAGTTRAAMLRLSPRPVHEVIATADKLARADVLFLTNTRVGIWPVGQLIGAQIESDIGNALLIKLQKALVADRTAYLQAHQADWA